MNLYLLRQTVNKGYDTYDSVVVAAYSAEQAAEIHPCGNPVVTVEDWKDFGDWAKSLTDIHIKYIGKAVEGTKVGVVCASFNAG